MPKALQIIDELDFNKIKNLPCERISESEKTGHRQGENICKRHLIRIVIQDI